MQKQFRIILFFLSTSMFHIDSVYAKSVTDIEIDPEKNESIFMTGLGEEPGLGLQSQWSGDYSRKPEYDDTKKAYVDELETALTLSGFTDSTDSSRVYVKASALASLSKSGFSKRTFRLSYIELDELWLAWYRHNDSAMTIRFGRQSWSDESGWWWDSTIDALALRSIKNKTEFSLAVATTGRDARTDHPHQDPNTEDQYWFLGSIRYAIDRGSYVQSFLSHLQDKSSGYVTNQSVLEQDYDSQDDRLFWLGIRLHHAMGQMAGQRFSFLVNVAGMTGQSDINSTHQSDDDDDSADDELTDTDVAETPASFTTDESDLESLTIDKTSRQKQQGWAVDTRIDWQPDFAENWIFSAGWAAGSGTSSNLDAGTRTFKPTGLQDYQNDTGVNYYGAALNPELGNLQITTLMLQTSVNENLHFTLLFNHYRRMSRADDVLRNELDLEYQTNSKSVGTAVGLSLNLEFDEVELELSASTFHAGGAFGEQSGDRFNLVELEFSMEF